MCIQLSAGGTSGEMAAIVGDGSWRGGPGKGFGLVVLARRDQSKTLMGWSGGL